jgi:hypothetical protein
VPFQNTTFSISAAVLLGAAISCMAAQAWSRTADGFHQLTGAQIRQQIIGKEVTDNVHWREDFLPKGVLKQFSMGEPWRGAWWIDHDLLCTRTRYDGDACYEVWRKGAQVKFMITSDVERFSGYLEPLPTK